MALTTCSAVAGKSVAIFGDTALRGRPRWRGVDVMVHETNAITRQWSEKANARDTAPICQTATLAREAAAGRLIATHISSRYDDKGCQRYWRMPCHFPGDGAGLRFFLFSRLAPIFVLISR